MILEIEHDRDRLTVELTEDAGMRRVHLNGTETACDWLRVDDRQYSLILGGRVYDFFIEISDGKCSVVGRDGSFALRISDARRLLKAQDVEEGQCGLQRITADMPGKVVRVLVSEGDSVTYDQGLLVLEAMKMQNEIRAPKSGLVREIGVSPGMAVGTGEFLLSLE